MKASAVAHPIQGLIKYHGLKDEELRLPFHDSISVCTAPLQTHTTFEFGDFPENEVVIDGEPVAGREFERVGKVIAAVQERSGIEQNFKMHSRNNFPSNVGLGASSSGFGALAVSACAAAGLDLDLQEMSKIARLGAGSAARAVTGGFSRWKKGMSDVDSYSYQIASEELQMGILIALVPAYKSTEDAHREVQSSPYFDSRLAEMPRMLDEMELAIRQGDVGKVCQLAERDTLLLHGITMTGVGEMLLWRPETISVIMQVRKLREENVPAFFSIDTGATVYVNTFPNRLQEVKTRLEELGIEIMECEVGGEAKVVDDHLF
ncbi:MAG: diphosphomevalonate decarboxylase [Methanobacteriota archaeon]|nr:MAG: diphosphomevalonate decarboxylase [Euryarchaeota archaeon]